MNLEAGNEYVIGRNSQQFNLREKNDVSCKHFTVNPYILTDHSLNGTFIKETKRKLNY